MSSDASCVPIRVGQVRRIDGAQPSELSDMVYLVVARESATVTVMCSDGSFHVWVSFFIDKDELISDTV